MNGVKVHFISVRVVTLTVPLSRAPLLPLLWVSCVPLFSLILFFRFLNFLPFPVVIRVMVTVTHCPFSLLFLEILSLLPSNRPLTNSLTFPFCFSFPVCTPCCFCQASPMPLFPAPLCPVSAHSVVLWFDICVYLVTVCSVGSRTDRVGLNKERKLGNGSAHAHTNTEILEHKLQWPCCHRCALYVQNFLTCLNLACS